ncbi:TonB-dependent receptor [Hymenobacter busanensis]|uniref:TonB-dependent receptor n=1 Tax=Hymenobacter busanensis TaxID=2607656 RepID=A0A7L4ZVE7_9BACT|nr:TonB-dependent receptor [Hymenobacter busanensis]KAA9332249.1 TonB-dependent receptor [Hymenobacter busanensis]QHJ07414.1 TonB-dependent receptor [Hymenobacter busanensis]
MKQVRLRHLLLLLLTLLSAQLGWSQGVTTSSMSGVVTDKSGEGLPGATVIAVHTPTNSQYVAPTNADGRYNIQAMRVGGPYTVRVTFVGYQEAVREGIFLSLGQNLRLDVNLSETTQTLAGVEVQGRRDALINSDRTGSVTNIQREQIERLPSITRSLNDLTRLTPQANGQSVGGGNSRQNFITVDGSDFNNNFGIGGNLPAGGSPISLDAIEQISVSVAPFDVRQSGFIGSAVNAVTRSGSNNFSGSVYSYGRTEDFYGDKVGKEKVNISNSTFYQYGARLGGPIIKDKLFFFVNFEDEKNTVPGQTRTAATLDANGKSNFGTSQTISRPTRNQLDEISTYLNDRYGYKTGPYEGYDFVSPRTKILGRLDWTINNRNRFNIRYSQTNSKRPAFPNGTSTSLPFSGSRQDLNAMFYQNSGYNEESNFYSLAGELNSTFGSNMGNTFRATYTKQNDPRSSESSIFPFVDILQDGSPFTSFGYELFSYGNLRDVAIKSFKDDFTWNKGIHNVTLGAQIDLSETKNGFQRYGTSYYQFASWQDFVTASNPDPNIAKTALPNSYAITYSLSPGYKQAFPSFTYGQYAAYLQDEITVTDRLRITPGIRADFTSFGQDLKEHPLITPLTFNNGEKINVANLPKNRVLWSPRVGFNYDVKGDRTLQLRGGTGIFTGRVPYVWIVSQASDAGMIQITQINNGAAVKDLQGGYRGFSPDPRFYLPETPAPAGTVAPSQITALDPDFRFPQTWKSSIGVDVQLPLGIVGTLEGIYNKDLNTALFRNANLVTPKPLNIAGYPDNRLIYPANDRDKFVNPVASGKFVANGASNGGAFNAYVLDNASKGYYWSATAKLEKQFGNGIYASAAYVHSEAKNLYDGSGDQVSTAWQGNQTVNGANTPELSYANYVTPDRVIGSLSYRKEYLGHLGTTLSLFYEGGSTGRYSYTYSTDFNRDGANADLIYVPKDASEITFTTYTIISGSEITSYSPQQQSDAFFKFIEQDKYLRTRKGKYAERNGAQFPWRNQFDVKLLQDIFVNIGEKRNTLQLSLDVFNVGNLLNNEWGAFQSTTVNNNQILVPVGTLNQNGTTKPTFRMALDRATSNQLASKTFRNSVSLSSTYYMQVGLRYIFN